MALSRSSHSRWQAWAIRAIAALLVVYMLGTFSVPTRIPYLVVVIAALVDGLRCVIAWAADRQRRARTTARGETIH